MIGWYRVLCAWDPVGAPAPSAQVTPASSPCKSFRSQSSPVPPSVSQAASPGRSGYTPVSDRAARRLEALLQQKLATGGQESSAESRSEQDGCCDSLPSQLGFITAAPVDNFDSPAHMLPGPEQVTGQTPEPVETSDVRFIQYLCDIMRQQVSAQNSVRHTT
jgi:hypothetical protein